MDPTAEPIELPEGYGTATTTVAWPAVRERRLVVRGSPATLHQRNLSSDQRVVVHLEDTMAAVILEGTMRRQVPSPELAGRLRTASMAKYGYEPPAGAYEAGVWVLGPARARAWSAFPDDVTRFRFG